MLLGGYWVPPTSSPIGGAGGLGSAGDTAAAAGLDRATATAVAAVATGPPPSPHCTSFSSSSFSFRPRIVHFPSRRPRSYGTKELGRPRVGPTVGAGFGPGAFRPEAGAGGGAGALLSAVGRGRGREAWQRSPPPGACCLLPWDCRQLGCRVPGPTAGSWDSALPS